MTSFRPPCSIIGITFETTITDAARKGEESLTIICVATAHGGAGKRTDRERLGRHLRLTAERTLGPSWLGWSASLALSPATPKAPPYGNCCLVVVRGSIRYYAGVQLAFATKTLRQLCESQRSAERRFGVRVAEMLQHRLADIAAAKNATDLVAGGPNTVSADPHEHLVLSLSPHYQLVMSANHNSVRTLPDGSVDWSAVARVQILRIEEVAHA